MQKFTLLLVLLLCVDYAMARRPKILKRKAPEVVGKMLHILIDHTNKSPQRAYDAL